ncbi:MAG: 6-bladed beta-propeller [Methanococcaceae archaeon]
MKNKLVCLSFFFLSFLVIYQSGSSQSGNENLIRLKADFAKTGSIKMSELFSEIRYIPLETNQECLIGSMNIPVFGKEIIIKSHDNTSIFRFSEQGKFLNKIGSVGRGPGEYQDYCDVVLNGDTIYVVSNFSDNIICYSLDGVFLKNYHLNVGAHPKSLVQLRDKSFMVSLSNPSNLGNIIKTDKDFNIKAGFIKNIPLKSNPLPFRFQKSKNKIYYYYNYLDTIFEISKGYPIPSNVIDYGDYNISKEKRSVYEKNNAILNKPSILDFSASEEFLTLYTYYPFNGGIYTTLLRIADGKQTTWNKLINDIDNGTLERWPGFLAGNNLVFCLMASTILDRFKNMTKAEKSDPKNSVFVNLASKITPESNPVIMICKLK